MGKRRTTLVRFQIISLPNRYGVRNAAALNAAGRTSPELRSLGGRLRADSGDLRAGCACHKIESPSDIRFHLLAVDHGVQHAVLKKKFTALESLRKFLSNSLFNHPRAGETNQRTGLGNIQVAQHGKRSRDSAR